MLSLNLYSLASSSRATHQHVLEPLRLRSQVNVSSILYNAHLETGMAPLYWWVWSIKVGVAAKFFRARFACILSNTPPTGYANDIYYYYMSFVRFKICQICTRPPYNVLNVCDEICTKISMLNVSRTLYMWSLTGFHLGGGRRGAPPPLNVATNHIYNGGRCKNLNGNGV